jgi:transcriptional regulator with XRE-family HTH domain
MDISQENLGRRIAAIRKDKGLSQEDLASLIKISRSAVTQIECGKRAIDALELHKLSHAFAISMDEMLSAKFELKKAEAPKKKSKASPSSSQQSERIAIPKMDVSKFRNVLLYLLERCSGKPNVGETVLYKLLYFADFNYYELYEEHLTGAKYRKLPFGPVPHKLDDVLALMIKEGDIQRVKSTYFKKVQTRFLPLRKPDLTAMKASEMEVLDKVIAQLSDLSAAAISEYSHKDLPWIVCEQGEEISYELAFYREAPFSVRNYGNQPETA